MKIIFTDLIKEIQDVHSTENGNFYFFENYVISEIHEGVIYNWEAAQELILLINAHYGPKSSINFISNRVNKYSIVPTDWIKFYNNQYSSRLNSYSIVSYTNSNLLNIMIEKLFMKVSANHFSDINLAIHSINSQNTLESA